MIRDSTEFNLVVREWMWYICSQWVTFSCIHILWDHLPICPILAPSLYDVCFFAWRPFVPTGDIKCVLPGDLQEKMCFVWERCVLYGTLSCKIYVEGPNMRRYLPVFLSIQFRNKDICPGLICMIRPTFYGKCSLFYRVVCLSIFFFGLSYRNCKGLSRLTILSNLSLGVLLTLRVSVFSADWIFFRALVLLNSIHTHTHGYLKNTDWSGHTDTHTYKHV